VVISGQVMDDYMGIKGLEADHVTLAIEDPHTEVQLLHYHHPAVIVDADAGKLNKVGFNHICFGVDDLDAEVARLTAAGVKLRNKVMDFHSRKLVFLRGPEDITVELAKWH
jgi:catechol 2,3-dioxygenase-like lactoylglutathione lyase family enzyme